MRNKKLFNRLMAIIMCSTLTVSTPIMTYATETENVEETLQTAEEPQADENGFVIEGSVLTRYVGTAEHVVVPEGVTQIGVYAFKGCSGLKEVTIPDSVTRIEANAFEECTTLTKITIPDSVTIIGAYAFNGCSGLTEIAIPNGVTTLGRATFGGCTSLTKVTIPSSVTTFTDRVFIGCTSLTEITIPDSVKTIGDYTFSGCSQLKEITIPNTVTYIGDGAFEGCSGLTIYGEKDSVAHEYAQENGIEFKVLGEENEDSEQSEFIIENGVLTRYVGTAEHVVVPEGVTKIDVYAFAGSEMVSVKLPKSLQTIVSFAFWDCENLEHVEFSSAVSGIMSFAFAECKSLKSIELPNGLTEISSGIVAYCSSLETVVIPDSVTKIWRGAFTACTSLKKIVIPDSVEMIYPSAFAESWIYEDDMASPKGQMDITICGSEGSYAQQFAEAYEFKFELLSEEPETPEQPNEDVEIPNDKTGIPDKALYNGILKEADTNKDGKLTVKEAEAVEGLSLSKLGISDLTGLSYCKNIATLYLDDNNISNISELSKIESIYDCDLSGNNISDISPLVKVNIGMLNLSNNKIGDISAFASFESKSWYGELNLSNNNIRNIDALEGFGIGTLYLSNNNIRDISVLDKITIGNSVKTDGNPIGEKETYTKEQFNKLLGENSTSDVVIEANDNITITFGKGTMKEVDGVTSYDFTATTTNDYKASKLPTSVKEGEFVLKISYNYSGKLPADASVKIFVGKEYNGKTLYYSLLKEDGTLTETQKAVVEDGYMTVTQSHCSDWIITTTNPTSENNQNNGGQDNNNQNDNSDNKDNSNENKNDNSDGKDDSNENKNESPDTGENNAWVSTILLLMSVALLGIAKKRKNF